MGVQVCARPGLRRLGRGQLLKGVQVCGVANPGDGGGSVILVKAAGLRCRCRS